MDGETEALEVKEKVAQSGGTFMCLSVKKGASFLLLDLDLTWDARGKRKKEIYYGWRTLGVCFSPLVWKQFIFHWALVKVTVKHGQHASVNIVSTLFLVKKKYSAASS